MVNLIFNWIEKKKKHEILRWSQYNNNIILCGRAWIWAHVSVTHTICDFAASYSSLSSLLLDYGHHKDKYENENNTANEAEREMVWMGQIEIAHMPCYTVHVCVCVVLAAWFIRHVNSQGRTRK